MRFNKAVTGRLHSFCHPLLPGDASGQWVQSCRKGCGFPPSLHEKALNEKVLNKKVRPILECIGEQRAPPCGYRQGSADTGAPSPPSLDESTQVYESRGSVTQGHPFNPTTGSSPWQAAFTQKQTLPASSSRRPARGRRKGKDSEKFQVMDDYLSATRRA